MRTALLGCAQTMRQAALPCVECLILIDFAGVRMITMLPLFVANLHAAREAQFSARFSITHDRFPSAAPRQFRSPHGPPLIIFHNNGFSLLLYMESFPAPFGTFTCCAACLAHRECTNAWDNSCRNGSVSVRNGIERQLAALVVRR